MEQIVQQCIILYHGSYCGRHVWEIARHARHDSSSTVISDYVGNGRAQRITYKYAKTTEMSQSLAYAQKYTLSGTKTSDYEMQRIVWGSWQFKQYTGGDSGLVEDVKQDGTWTTTSDGMKGRSYQFANFIYKALDDQGRLNMTFTPLNDEDDNLRIMVDQNSLKYTVGPYVLNFDRQEEGCVEGTGDQLMKDLVYEEIMGRNPGWTEENAFCKGKIQALITYEDNTHELKEIGLEVLDANGIPITDNFPKFGETFYLRYQTTLDEDIRYIRPSIQISHLKKLTNKGNNYEVCTYTSKHIKYSMIEDLGGLFKRAMIKIKDVYGVNLITTMEAHAIGQHWEIYDQSLPMNLTTYNPYNQNHSVRERIEYIVDINWKWLEDCIREEGGDWGLGTIDIDAGYTPCLYWRGQYYEDIDCKIVGECVNRHWEKDEWDALTQQMVTHTDEGLNSPGSGWNCVSEDWESHVENPLPGMEGMRGHGDSDDEAQDDLQNQISPIYPAFKLNSLIIDEDILESQPCLFLERIEEIEDWQDREIIIEEMLRKWNIKEGEEYYGKENFSGNMIKEEQDWAIEAANLPRKRNKYVCRAEMYGKICRRLNLENLLV